MAHLRQRGSSVHVEGVVVWMRSTSSTLRYNQCVMKAEKMMGVISDVKTGTNWGEYSNFEMPGTG